ncbi:MAG TPA: hypothetical protein VM344_08110 [Vitreimonas sp.]|nr:hypothetical protein [Vitreimonas sp.]
MRIRLASLVLLVAACGAPVDVRESLPPAPELGGTWTVARVGGSAAVPLQEPRAQFFPQPPQLRIVSSCSEVTVEVRVEGSSIRFGGFVPAALVPCEGPARQFDGQLMSALEGARSVRGGPGRVTIDGPGDDVLLVSSALQPSADEIALLERLTSGSWRHIGGDLLPNDAIFPIRFGQGSLLAAGECGFAGEWTYRGEDLVVLHGISWDATGPCSAAGQRARADLVRLLEQTTRVRVVTNETAIRLEGRDGFVLLEWEPLEP